MFNFLKDKNKEKKKAALQKVITDMFGNGRMTNVEHSILWLLIDEGRFNLAQLYINMCATRKYII